MYTLREIEGLEQISNLELLANQIVEGFLTGLHKSPYHGFSAEFSEHRSYNAGESIRFIDWKIYARTEKLFVKKFEEETNLRCNILIDTSSSMLFPDAKHNKLLFSAICAASLTNLLVKQRDAVGLTLFSDKIEIHLEPKLNPTHIKFLYARLEELLTQGNLNINKNTNIAETLHQIAEMIHKRSLVIIFSDMFEKIDTSELFSAINHLKHSKHEVIIFNTYDSKYEYHFKYDKRPYKFIDLETGETIKLNPNEIGQFIEKKLKEFYNEIKIKALSYNVDFVEADINESFNEVLLQFLYKRQKLQ